MLIAFQDIRPKDIKNLRAAYAAEGYKMRAWIKALNWYFVDLHDGLRSLAVCDPESSSGIFFRLERSQIDICQLHITQSKRGRGQSKTLLVPLIDYARTRDNLRICLRSVNDPFWSHIQQEYRYANWDIAWEKPHEEFEPPAYISRYEYLLSFS